MVACLYGNPDHVQDLLEVPGIKIDLQNDEGHHALMCACEQGHIQVAELVIRAHPSPQELVNLSRKDGVTCLMLASQGNYETMVSLLLKNRANINMQDNDGKSSLMLASVNGHTEIVSHLLQNDAHVNTQKKDGQSSLMMASQNGHTETVSILLQNGADVDMQENSGKSSLIIASQY